MKKNKKVLLLITLLMCFVSFKEVKAVTWDTYNWSGYQIGSSGYSGIANGSTSSFDIDLVYFGETTDDITQKYGLTNAWNGSGGSNGTSYKFLITMCQNAGGITGFYNSNNHLIKKVDSGLSCTVGSYNGYVYYYFVELTPNKYNIGNSTVYSVTWNSTTYFNNTWGYYGFYRVSNVDILTDEEFNSLINDYTDISLLNSQISKIQETNAKLDTQISQNQTIIDQNNQTNSKLDSTNSTLTSDDSDTTSSKCGVVCKLKGIFTGIVELPVKLVTLLIDALKSLFIPDDMSFVTDFVDAIESKLGFIAAVPIKIIEFILNLASASWSEFKSISFPSISIFGYSFWNSQEIDLTEAINIFKPFKYVTDVICVVICANTLNKWRERFTGGN